MSLPLSPARIEAWALGVLARVRSGLRVEDTRVELKRVWPAADKAARELAGHANSAIGSEILWILGVDEADGIMGITPEELSDWWSAICSHFDGLAPSLTELLLQVDGKTLCAMAFDTSRAPFVVKNPHFGQPGGGSIALEAPWREGTAVRSATRNDLVRLLLPVAMAPDFEPLKGFGELFIKTSPATPNEPRVTLAFSLTAYLSPRSEAPLVVPFHRCSCTVRTGSNHEQLDGFEVTFGSPWFVFPAWLVQSNLTLIFRVVPVHAPMPMLIEVSATPRAAKGSEAAGWTINAGDGLS